MLSHKHIDKIIAVITVIIVCLCLATMAFAEQLTEATGGEGVTMEYETELFDTSKIISLNIVMDEEEWQEMLDNSTSEEYYQCDVEINGRMFYSVGIRPKGNTSLTSIASDPTTDRYSFKLELDRLADGQTSYVLDKLVLNNNYADATNMKEALIYDMYAYLETDASLYNYAEISVNGEYWGVYLALEAVEDSFLMRNYGVKSGELYKPDSMDIGGGFGGGESNNNKMDFGNMTPPNTGDGNKSEENFSFPDFGGGGMPENFDPSKSGEEMPDRKDFDFSDKGGMGGFSMGGNGSDLNYTDDDPDSYSTIWDCEVTDTSDSDHKRVITALKNISEGNDLETYMDIGNLLKYMAVHIFSVNSDSLSGNMAHNYYLYEENGQLNILPWDYNLALGGMGGGSDATSTVNEAIDNAFSGTKFFDTLMENEEYHQQYYAYMQKLVDEYLLGDGFESFYNRVRGQIDKLVETDPNTFYTYEEYLTAVETLYEVVKLRAESINGQLNGTIPSTSGEQRNSDALIDASHIDLGVMGSMNMGGGGFGGGKPSGRSDNSTEKKTENDITSATSLAKTQNGTSAVSLSFNPSQLGNEMPEGFDPSQFGGEMPEGFDPSQFGGEMPEGFDPSQFGGEMPEGFDSFQPEENSQGEEDTEGNTEQPSSPQNGESTFDRNNMPDRFSDNTSSSLASNLIVYGICIVILVGALIFAKLFRRRNRKR